MQRRRSSTRTTTKSDAVKPKRRRAVRLSPESRRQQLLACALRVFARRGIGEGRHAEIAKEARVAVPTVFAYFPTRKALVDAVLDEVARFYIDMTQRIHARRELSASEVLLLHAREFSRSVVMHEEYARVWLDWSTSVREGVWPRYLEFQREVVTAIAETIRRGQRERSIPGTLDAHFAALFVVSAAHMVAQLQFSHQPADVLEGFLQTLVHAVTSGARTGHAGSSVSQTEGQRRSGGKHGARVS
ncbi:MAG: TetR/AcrR family transcriptional regulator [Candidatus Binatia bacterium]|nr:TetR/AcrR family transcriptional regulator [Candidatus Binatia bacterium]